MIKKIFGGAVIAAIVLGTFGIGQAYVASAQEKALTNAQLIETLISLGIIPADKAAAARAVVAPAQPVVATTTASARLVSTPTIELSYDSKGNLRQVSSKEALLSAKANVVVTAGNKGDFRLLSDIYTLHFMNEKNVHAVVNSYKTEMSPVTKGIKKAWDGDNGRNYFAIPAGTSAEFQITATVDPKTLFAGNYYATISSVFSVDAARSAEPSVEIKVSAGKGVSLKSASKTVVGEVSPYITSVTPSVSAGQMVSIQGVRLQGAKILIDGSVPAGLAYKDGNGTSLQFNLPSNISVGNHYISVRNSTTGDSNKVGFTVTASVTQSPAATIAATSTPAASVSINSLSPVGGESYVAGDTVTVKWNIDGLTAANNSIGLAVYQTSLGAKKSVVSTTVGNPVVGGKVSADGSYSWKIATSTPAGTDYVVYLSTAQGWKQSGAFSVSAPSSVTPIARAEFTSLGAPSISQTSSAEVGNTSTTTITAQFNVRIKAVDGDVSFEKSQFAPFTFAVYKNGVRSDLSSYISNSSFQIPSSGVVTTSLATSSLLFTIQKNNQVDIPVVVNLIPSGSTASYSVGLEKIRYVLPNLQSQTVVVGTSSPSLWSTGTVSASGRNVSGAGAAFLSLQGIVNWVTSLVK
jgi:hypothetical protein